MTDRHPLPWRVDWLPVGWPLLPDKPRIVDANGVAVAVCAPSDLGRETAIEICRSINLAGPKVCANCGKPAACFGSYEDDLHPAYACDECCGHGNEDGHCEPVSGGTS